VGPTFRPIRRWNTQSYCTILSPSILIFFITFIEPTIDLTPYLPGPIVMKSEQSYFDPRNFSLKAPWNLPLAGTVLLTLLEALGGPR